MYVHPVHAKVVWPWGLWRLEPATCVAHAQCVIPTLPVTLALWLAKTCPAYWVTAHYLHEHVGLRDAHSLRSCASQLFIAPINEKLNWCSVTNTTPSRRSQSYHELCLRCSIVRVYCTVESGLMAALLCNFWSFGCQHPALKLPLFGGDHLQGEKGWQAGRQTGRWGRGAG